jgi:hypothetical protein
VREGEKQQREREKTGGREEKHERVREEKPEREQTEMQKEREFSKGRICFFRQKFSEKKKKMTF